ncbi:peptide transporter family 1-like [Macrosteles quadrilineatus]|uniref:peptide transporter family 1-like n=1 Tax=Macrosteles quadrilineatus TaxID=74068 RepID=UPI0023E210CA|nr:peptide transporter family 1-like [Macrosteles quadrilineatus]
MSSQVCTNPDGKSLNGAGANDLEVEEKNEKPLKYPKQVFFIISNEFCERFCFYGNRTILAIYLQSKLNYSEDDATVVYHTFVMLCYFFPFLGAIIADCFWGKFRTILYLSIIYAIGNIVLATASSMELSIDPTTFSLLGLFLIAVGTGGIKPCVSSFGGDQFVVPQQERQLASFFSVFYFSINAGSTISTYLTPELRVMPCLGSDSCYPLAFGVPAALMVTALVFFVCGKTLYTMKNPEGNIMVDASKCVGRGIRRKISSNEKKEHWLDHAADKYNPQLVEDTKILIELIYLFSPTILFWALYDQQGSRWTFQAVHMNGKIWNYTIKPDQMQAVNPILIMIFIPLFDFILYPVLGKLGLVKTSLRRLFWGGIIAAVAFAMSAYVEYKVQDSYAVLPQAGEAQLRIYNSYNCPLHIDATGSGKKFSWSVGSMGLLEEKSIPVTGKENLMYSAAFVGTGCPTVLPATVGILDIFEAEAVSFIVTESQNSLQIVRLDETFDDLEKSDNTESKIRVVYNVLSDETFSLFNKQKSSKVDGTLYTKTHSTETYLVEPTGDYSLQVNGKEVATNLPLDVGGVYTILIGQNGDKAALFTLTPPNSVHILWQLPQIIVISAAEIMFSITGLEFSYSKAPQSMKSVISSLWLLTDSFGNLLIIVVSELTKSVPQVYMLAAFAVMMVVVMMVFVLLARRYICIMRKIENK